MSSESPGILYLNCTANAPHIGCLAVTDYHIRSMVELGYQITDILYSDYPWFDLWKGDRKSSLSSCLNGPIEKMIQRSDAVVINGEGTLHHDRGRGLLVAAEAAMTCGKNVYLINTSISHIDEFDDVLKGLNDLNVRELESSRLLGDRSIGHRVVLDSFLGARFHTMPDRSFDGKTVVMDWHPNRDRDVGDAILSLFESGGQDHYQFFPLNHYSHIPTWRHTVENLKSSGLIVTGRYHGVYLAGLAGRPFVAMSSNTRKIEGLIKASSLPIPICSDRKGLEKAIREAKGNPSIFIEFQEYLEGERPLETFTTLASEMPSPRSPEKAEIDAAISEIEERITAERLDSQYRMLLSSSRNRVRVSLKASMRQILRLGYDKAKSALG